MKQKSPPLQGEIGYRELSADRRYWPDVCWWIWEEAVSSYVEYLFCYLPVGVCKLHLRALIVWRRKIRRASKMVLKHTPW